MKADRDARGARNPPAGAGQGCGAVEVESSMAAGPRTLGVDRSSAQPAAARSPPSRESATSGRLSPWRTRPSDFSRKTPSIWNTLGLAHFRARHWDEAIAALKKAGELGHDENVTGWYHLAMAYWHKGDKEQARQWYAKAVTWMENNPAKNGEFVAAARRGGCLDGDHRRSQTG